MEETDIWRKNKTGCMTWGTSLGKPHPEVILEQRLEEVKRRARHIWGMHTPGGRNGEWKGPEVGMNEMEIFEEYGGGGEWREMR